MVFQPEIASAAIRPSFSRASTTVGSPAAFRAANPATKVRVSEARVTAPVTNTKPGSVKVAEVTGYSDHPLLVAQAGKVYLSWLTTANGYRLIEVGRTP